VAVGAGAGPAVQPANRTDTPSTTAATFDRLTRFPLGCCSSSAHSLYSIALLHWHLRFCAGLMLSPRLRMRLTVGAVTVPMLLGMLAATCKFAHTTFPPAHSSHVNSRCGSWRRVARFDPGMAQYVAPFPPVERSLRGAGQAPEQRA